jgi:hypothetical protein
MVVAAVAPFAALLAVLYVLWRLVRTRLPKRPVPAPAHVPSEEEGGQG